VATVELVISKLDKASESTFHVTVPSSVNVNALLFFAYEPEVNANITVPLGTAPFEVFTRADTLSEEP
jgi:hypothetical protein